MPPVEGIGSAAAWAPGSYGIPPHVYLCATGTGTVILDVRRDRYLGLGREETELLANAVPGWPNPLWRTSASCDAHASSEATFEVCESLIADGVLERIAKGQKARAILAIRDMRRDWISIGDELEIRGRLTPRHIVNFLTAYCWARSSLAWRSFSFVVERIRARKPPRARGIAPSQLRKVAALVDVFRQLRPFVFAAEGRCLLHALTLTRFLSNYQIYPEWVIGVTTQPWGAHSWVQWDNYLLDSNPEKVCGYTPIMAV